MTKRRLCVAVFGSLLTVCVASPGVAPAADPVVPRPHAPARGAAAGGGPPPCPGPAHAGYVKAKELPDGDVPPADADGNFIIGPTHKRRRR